MLWLAGIWFVSCQSPSSDSVRNNSIDSLTVVQVADQARQLADAGKFQEASVILDMAIAIGTRAKLRGLPVLHYQQGVASTELGRFDKSLDHFKRCLSYFESDTERRSTLAQVYHRMGVVYYRLHDFEKSLEYLGKVKDTDVSPEKHAELFIDRALSLAGHKEFKAGLKLLDDAEARLRDESLRAKLMFARGNFALLLEHRREARHFFLLASTAGRKAQPRLWMESDLFLTQIYLDTKDFTRVPVLLHAVEAEADRLGLADLRLKCYGLSAELHLALGNYSDATQYQDRFLQLRDQLYGEELLHKALALQVEFEERHQVQKIKEQDELMRLKEKSLREQRNVSIVIALICVLLIVILIILALNYRETRRMNIQLDFMVRDKTQHLEVLHSELHTANYKRILGINNIAREFRATMASLKGMCYVGKIDSEAAISLEKLVLIERTVIDVASIVEPLMSDDVEQLRSSEFGDNNQIID